MALSPKAIERINGMTVKQCKAKLAEIDDGLASEELRPHLDARIKFLTPTANAAYPEQAALDALILQRNTLNDRIKAMIEEAKAGNYSYRTEPNGRLQNTGRASKSGGAGSGKRGNAGDLVITVNGTEHTSWKTVCDQLVPTLVADKAAKGVEERNIGWRAEAVKAAKKQQAAVALEFKSADKFATYEANGWLAKGFTVVKSF